MQWRLLLERRTTGYVWCDPSSTSARNSVHENEINLNHQNHSDGKREQYLKQTVNIEDKNNQMAESKVSLSEVSEHESQASQSTEPKLSDIDSNEDVGSSGRSRLAGLKQLSFASLTNIRQKISEGRRLLAASSTRVMGSSADGSSSDIYSVRGSVSSQGGCYCKSEDDGIPEPLNAKVGGTRLSLQKATTAKNIAQSTCGKGTPPQGMVLAGLFPETAILTFHNIELEVLPQVVKTGISCLAKFHVKIKSPILTSNQ